MTFGKRFSLKKRVREDLTFNMNSGLPSRSDSPLGWTFLIIGYLVSSCRGPKTPESCTTLPVRRIV